MVPARNDRRLCVTVAIVTRDRPDMLRQSLSSVVAQSRPADEIVVVDDGVQDSAADVCGAFPGVRYERSAARGIAAARNRAVALAAGEIVVVHDDDDAMLPNRIAEHVAAFRDDVDATCGSWVNASVGTRAATLKLVPGQRVPTLEGLLLGHACMAHGATAYRAGLLRAHPYDETLAAGSDMDLHARMLAAGARIRHTGTIAILRRLHTESVTQRFGDEQRRIKQLLQARHLPAAHAEQPTLAAATPVIAIADLRQALVELGLDGEAAVFGGAAKTLAAVATLADPEVAGELKPIGAGGFVDVLVPVRDERLATLGGMVGWVPLAQASEMCVDEAYAASPDAVGLADGGARILIALDGIAVAGLRALDRPLSSVSPSWRFVAGHAVLTSAFAAAPRLVLASNRFAIGPPLLKAFTSVAESLRAMRLPASRLGVATLRDARVVGLSV